jgi:hypothetical protein
VHVTPEELASWERRLDSWEADLTRRTAAIDDQVTSLPAAPVRGVFLHLLEDRKVADLDTRDLAKGLGLEHQFVLDVLSGDRQSLDVREVAATCDALHASPFDLWKPEEARQIVGAYGPEHWPRYIEPVDDLYDPEPSGFVTRRADQMANELLAGARAAIQSEAQDLRVVVTAYRHVGVLAVDSRGTVERVGDVQAPAAAHVDYFFTFEQIRRPLEVDVTLDGRRLPDVAPPGEDAPRPLAAIASGLQEWSRDVSMVRFTDPETGEEHWLGLDPSAATWQTWGDPTDGYPGSRTDVLQVGPHLDPEMLTDHLTSSLSVVRPPALDGPELP